MLGEAVEIIRLLWQGGMRSYRGCHLQISRAQVFDLPDRPPSIAIAAGGPLGAAFAAQNGDGLFATDPNPELVRAWREAGGRGPAYAEVALSWARDEDTAIRVAHDRFRFGLLGWKVMADLPNPGNFEAATEWIRPQDVAEQITCGPDPERHLAAIRAYRDAGFDHIVLVGIGQDQEGFMRFWHDELAPSLRRES